MGPEVTSTTDTRIASCFFWVGGPGGHKHNRHANRELFFLGGWARRSRAGCDNLSQRHYDALTLYAVRGYVALTQDVDPRQFDTLTAVREGRFADGGARLVVFNSD